MSPSADDRPNESAGASPVSAEPSSGASEGPPPASSDLPKRDILTLPGGALPSLAPVGDQPQRRRRRRRRKGPRPPGAPGHEPSGAAGAPASGGDTQTPPNGDGATPEAAVPGEAVATAEGAALPGSAPAGQPSGDHPPKRRRRRRRKPRPPGTVAPGGEVAASPDGANSNVASIDAGAAPRHPSDGEAVPGREQRPRGRGRERRDFRSRENRPPREGAATAPDGAAPSHPPRERERDRPGKGPRDRDARDRKPGDRDRRDGGKRSFGGKGRDDFRRKPEPKLYSFESVVDRGFEEVADPANEGEMQRVAWTIVKRTLADQKAAKTVSAAYLLKRGEAVTEFANLATARAAVNKTIVHPEKLTRAKADYGSSKK